MTDTLLTFVLIVGGLWVMFTLAALGLSVYAFVEYFRRMRNDKH